MFSFFDKPLGVCTFTFIVQTWMHMPQQHIMYTSLKDIMVLVI